MATGEKYREWYLRNREKVIERIRKNNLTNRDRRAATDHKRYERNKDHILTQQAEYHRLLWQRTGRGVHANRVQDWRDFFDALTNEQRPVAAHIMLVLAAIDPVTDDVVRDFSFDYNYIAHAVEVT